MRERSTTTGSFSTISNRKYYSRGSCAGSWTLASTGPNTYSGVQTVKTISDVQTPRFNSLLKCGAFLPINPVSIITETVTVKPGSGTVYSNLVGGCHRNYVTGPQSNTGVPSLATVPTLDENLISALSTEAVANAREAIFDALTTLAELKETASLLRTNLARIKYFARKALRFADLIYRRKWRQLFRLPSALRKKRSLRAYFKALAGKWLEYRYGWLPSIYSIQDLIKALENNYSVNSIRRGRSTATVSLDDDGYSFSQDNPNRTSERWETLRGTRKYRATAYVKITSESKQKFGFDPLVTTWERIPLSFVIDWVVGVGSWLKAVSPFQGSSLLGVCVGIKDEYTWHYAWQQIHSVGESGSFTNPDATHREVKSYTRVTSAPGSLPSWNPRLTNVRLVDLAALFLGTARDIRRASR